MTSSACIQTVEYYLPEKILSNEDLRTENPSWNIELLQEKTGIYQRHISADDQTALDLAWRVCEQLLANNPSLRESIDGLIFCSQCTDHILPANSFILHHKLGLKDSLFAFTFNHGCSGFVNGLAMAKSFIASGMLTNVLLVCADTVTKYLHPRNRSTRMLFGDGASACWIKASEGAGEIRDVICTTHGSYYDKIFIPAGGQRKARSVETAREYMDKDGNVNSEDYAHMDGAATLNFVKANMPGIVMGFLEKNKLTMSDIDVVIFHQGSKMIIDYLLAELDIPNKKSFSNIAQVGNISSSSIPVAYKDALNAGVIMPQQKVLLVGFGVGFATAVALIAT